MFNEVIAFLGISFFKKFRNELPERITTITHFIRILNILYARICEYALVKYTSSLKY